MSKLLNYFGTACFLTLLIVAFGYNFMPDVKVTPPSGGTLNISVKYVGADKVEERKFTVPNLSEGIHQIAMESLTENCHMASKPQSVQIDSEDAAFISLQMKCNDSISSANQVLFVYDNLRNASVYVGDSGSKLSKIKAANISDPADEQSIRQRKIAFSKGGNIWSYNITQKKIRQLTDTGFDSNPDWSPQGSQIAFTSRRDGNAEVYVMDADGGNQQNVSNNPNVDAFPDWSPDGMKLVFTSNRDGDDELFMVYPNTQRVRQLTNNTIEEEYALWSSDGRELLVMSKSWMGLNQMHKVDFNGRILKTVIVFGDFFANPFDTLWTTTEYQGYIVSSRLPG